MKIEHTVHLRNFNKRGNYIVCTVDVREKGKPMSDDPVTSEGIEFSTKDEMNSRIKSILRTVNNVAELFPTLTDGEWTAPVVEEAVVDEPTAAEIDMRQRNAKHLDLQLVVDIARLKKEAAEFSLTDTSVAEKLEAFSPKVTDKR